MVQLTIKEGKEDLSFQFPEDWVELTFAQLLEIIKLREQNKANGFELVRVILNMNETDFGRLPHDVYLSLERVLLQWIKKEVDFSGAVYPSSFRFKGEAYTLPNDIGKQTIAQYKDAQNLFEPLQGKEGVLESELLALNPILIATYLQPIVTKSEYDYEKADAIAKDIWACSGLDILNFGNFFLLKAQALRNGTQRIAQKSAIQPSRFRQGMNNFLKWVASYIP